MERLTKYSNDLIRNKAVNILRKLDSENGLDGDELAIISSFCLIERVENKELKKYEDLEEQGKLLKLPCAVGDMVWDNDFGRPCSYEVTGFSFGNLNDGCVEEEMVLDQVLVYYTNSMGSITGSFAVSEIGKTVFLTQESAEDALKEMSE